MIYRLLAKLVRRIVRLAPEVFFVACMREIGWSIAVEEGKEMVEGMIIGNDKYLEEVLERLEKTK